MSPRIIHLPLSGRRDRRHYVRESRLAEQAHRDLPAKVEEAYRAAHRLACEEWSVRPRRRQLHHAASEGRARGRRVADDVRPHRHHEGTDRNIERTFSASRKDTHWGQRKLKRDE